MKVVSISGTRHNPRKKLPRAADLAAFLRSGDTAEDIAEAFGCSPRTVAQRLNEAGYSSTTGEKWEDKPTPPTTVVAPGLPFDAQPWADQAICATTDPDLFFPDRGQNPWTAKAICAGCPVRALCLDYALRNGEAFGVWGGLTEAERRRLKAGKPAVKVCAHPRCQRPVGGRGDRRYCGEKCKSAAEYERRLARKKEAS